MKLRLTTVLENGELLERDGLLYKPNSTEPLTAKVEQFDENGQLTIMYTAIDGKKEGLFQWWYDNGQLKQECTYVEGENEGLVKTFGTLPRVTTPTPLFLPRCFDPVVSLFV
jgi:antitoxin component YwqK of YwqJK toxin-antitoxin module